MAPRCALCGWPRVLLLTRARPCEITHARHPFYLSLKATQPMLWGCLGSSIGKLPQHDSRGDPFGVVC